MMVLDSVRERALELKTTHETRVANQGRRVRTEFIDDAFDGIGTEEEKQYYEGISAVDNVSNYSPLTDWIGGMVPPLDRKILLLPPEDDSAQARLDLARYMDELQLP